MQRILSELSVELFKFPCLLVKAIEPVICPYPDISIEILTQGPNRGVTQAVGLIAFIEIALEAFFFRIKAVQAHFGTDPKDLIPVFQ